MIKNLSDFKKLGVGTVLKTLQGIKFIGETREIIKKQSNGIYLSIPNSDNKSWLDYPKVDNFEVTEKGFKIYINSNFVLEYEIIKETK